jgi:hypothetical protein
MADKSMLVGDDAADLLLTYASLIGQVGRADTVTLNAIDGGGDEVVVGFLLNSGTALVIQTSTASFREPDNAEAIGYMRDRIASYGPSDTRSPFGSMAEEI